MIELEEVAGSYYILDLNMLKMLFFNCCCMYWLAAPAIELPIRHLRKPTRLETVKTRPITTSTIHFSLNVKRAVKKRQTQTTGKATNPAQNICISALENLRFSSCLAASNIQTDWPSSST